MDRPLVGLWVSSWIAVSVVNYEVYAWIKCSVRNSVIVIGFNEGLCFSDQTWVNRDIRRFVLASKRSEGDPREQRAHHAGKLRLSVL